MLAAALAICEPEPLHVIRAPEGAGPELRLAAVGDADGDGNDDYLIACGTDSRRVERGGSVQLVSGATGKVLLERRGSQVGERLGWWIAGPGDVDGDLDGDGRPEVAGLGWERGGKAVTWSSAWFVFSGAGLAADGH